MRLLPLLLLAACSTTPSTYERGTLTRPPPEHRPGVGLPVYEPHTAQSKRQPQPQPKLTRPLPPSEAPALWASSASPTAEPVPALLGWQAPSRLEGGPEKDGLPGFCVENARQKIEATTTAEFLAALDPNTRQCLAATSWAQCIEAFLLDFDRARRAKGTTSTAFWDYLKIGVHVRKLVRAECRGIEGFDRYIWRGP